MWVLLILIAFSALAGISSFYGWPVRPSIGTLETRASRAAYDCFSYFLGLGTLFGVEATFPDMQHTPARTGLLVLIGFGVARLLRPAFNDAAVRWLSRTK
jgi:hypothetical protein